jgi:hypothetical protein
MLSFENRTTAQELDNLVCSPHGTDRAVATFEHYQIIRRHGSVVPFEPSASVKWFNLKLPIASFSDFLPLKNVLKLMTFEERSYSRNSSNSYFNFSRQSHGFFIATKLNLRNAP